MRIMSLMVVIVAGFLAPVEAMNYDVSNTGSDDAPGTEL